MYLLFKNVKATLVILFQPQKLVEEECFKAELVRMMFTEDWGILRCSHQSFHHFFPVKQYIWPPPVNSSIIVKPLIRYTSFCNVMKVSKSLQPTSVNSILEHLQRQTCRMDVTHNDSCSALCAITQSWFVIFLQM